MRGKQEKPSRDMDLSEASDGGYETKNSKVARNFIAMASSFHFKFVGGNKSRHI